DDGVGAEGLLHASQNDFGQGYPRRGRAAYPVRLVTRSCPAGENTGAAVGQVNRGARKVRSLPAKDRPSRQSLSLVFDEAAPDGPCRSDYRGGKESRPASPRSGSGPILVSKDRRPRALAAWRSNNR